MHNTGHHPLTNQRPGYLLKANQGSELSQRQQKQSKSEGQPGQTWPRRTDKSANNSHGMLLLLLCWSTDAQTDAALDKYRWRNLYWAKCIIIAAMQVASCPRPPAGNPQIGYLCFGILSISSRCCYWECEEFLDDSWNVREIMGVPRIVKTNLERKTIGEKNTEILLDN